MINSLKTLHIQWLQGFDCVKFGLILVLFSACVTDPEQQAQEPVKPESLEQPATKPPESTKPVTKVPLSDQDPGVIKLPKVAYAKPITPDVVRGFPHLESFEGHFLIGHQTLQAVIAGVPSTTDKSPWQPSILRVFTLENRWKTSSAFGSLSISQNTLQPSPSPAVSIDAGASQDGKLAWVQIIYRPLGRVGSDKIVRYEVSVDAAAVRVRFPGNQSAWALKFGRGRGAYLLNKQEVHGGLEGHLFFSRYFDHESFYMLSYRPFLHKAELGEDIFKPERSRSSSQARSMEGYEFWFGIRESQGILWRLFAMKQCILGRESDLAGCMIKVPYGSASIKLSEADAGGKSLPLPMHVVDDSGQSILYAPLLAGEQIMLKLPTGREYSLSGSRRGKGWPTIGKIKPIVGQGVEVEIPPRFLGKASVSIRSDQEQAILQVTSLERAKGERVLFPEGSSPQNIFLSPNSVLVKEWPATIALLEGEYELVLVRSGSEQLCKKRFTIDSRRQVDIECVPEAPSANRLVMTVDADLATPAGTMTPAERRDFARVFGLQWLAGSAFEETPNTLPTRYANEAGTGLVLRWLGPSDQLDREPTYLSNDIVQFSKWVSLNAGFTEMSCPGPGMSLFDYKQRLLRFKPNAARVFGCRLGAGQDALLSVLGEVIQQSGRNIYLTPVSTLDFLNFGGGYGHLRIQQPKIEDSNALIKALELGNYIFAAGADVRLKSITEAKGSGRSNKVYEMTVRLEVDKFVRARRLVVYSERGVVHRQLLTEQESDVNTIKFEVPWRHSDKYVRIEVRGSGQSGSVSRLFDRGDGVHLSSTNFIPVASHLVTGRH